MKSLNRTLSLVLVLAMCLGLMGIASAASFTDTSKIKYTEAVDVMTGIGAINGYADGTINPAGTITREEAAKLIAYSVLGKDVASKLTVGATGFKDVDSNRWSAPFISYLVGQKIISGMGDGTFAPTANVTGYQLAKMMLCATGYGQKAEFTGTSWELAVAVAANKAKLFSGATGVDYSKAATREEAMLYAFNGIAKTPVVTYNKLFDQYQNVTTVTDGKTVNVAIKDQIYTQLAKKAAFVDGIMGYYWTLNGKTISSFVSDVATLATSKDGTSITDLTTTTNSSYIGYQQDTKLTYIYNGTESTLSACDAVALKRGAVVKFYDEDDNGKYNTISVTMDSVEKVTGAVTTKTTGAVTSVTVPGLPISSIDVKNVTGYEGLVADDIVLYHEYFVAGVKNYSLTKAATFTGTLNAYNVDAKVLVVDGKQYKVSEITKATSTDDYKKYATVAGTTFYTDAAGYVIAATASKTINTLENTVYVVEAGSVTFGTAQARILRADGKTEIVTVSKTAAKGGSLTPVLGNLITSKPAGDGGTAAIDNGELVANNLYTATKNTDGTYYLTVADTNDVASILKIDKGQPVLAANIYATNGTVFVYYDAVKGAKVYTGIANAPTNTGATTYACITDSNKLATIVIAVGGAYSAAAPATTKYVFAFAPKTTVKIDANTTYYQYNAVVDNEIKTIDMITTKELTPGALQAVTAFDNEKGAEIEPTYTNTLIATTKTLPVGSTGQNLTGIKDFKLLGTTLLAVGTDENSSGSYILNKDAKVFAFTPTNTNKPLVEISQSELDNMSGDTYSLQAVKTSTTDSSLKTLIVTITTAGAPGPSVPAGVKSVTHSADAYTVNYYGATVPTEAEGLAAVKAQLATEGWTISKTVLASGEYTFTVKNASDVESSKTWKVSTGIVKVYKIDLPTVATLTGYSITTTAPEYAKAGATYTVTVDITAAAASKNVKFAYAGTGASATSNVDAAGANAYASDANVAHTTGTASTIVFTVTVGTADVTGNAVTFA